MYHKKLSTDYIIIGAGSAGCVLANRLSSNPDTTVTLLEAGPKDGSWTINMPAALMYNLASKKYNWYYHTEPQKHLNNRVMYWPRGKVWGGSSSLNAMVYIRGHAKDFDRWHSEGATGWSYNDVLPYFKKSETYLKDKNYNYYRGNSGPLYVTTGPGTHPLHQAFITASMQAGYKYNKDINGPEQEGVGLFDSTIYNGQRWSASKAYLWPILDRPNLNILSQSLALKIIFNKNNPYKATGIEFIQNNKLYFIEARKDIILSGGAINSPQLLMLSGIGNSSDLKEHAIRTHINLPGVGQNLQDHLELYVQNQCTLPVTLYNYNKFPGKIISGIKWFLGKDGPCDSSHLETGAFIKSNPDEAHPNLQLHFLPSFVEDHGRAAINKHAYQVHIGPMRPKSRGTISLRSCNPKDAPTIKPNYLQDSFDLRELRESIIIAREIFDMPAFDKYRGKELLPGANINNIQDLNNYIKEHAETAYHPSCTCKMGSEYDQSAVVDNQGLVFGTENLRVCDASIMPSITSGNLNAPTIMMAEKIADMILLGDKYKDHASSVSAEEIDEASVLSLL